MEVNWARLAQLLRNLTPSKVRVDDPLTELIKHDRPIESGEILVSVSKEFDRYATESCRIVTTDVLDELQYAKGYRMGAIDPTKGNRWSQSLADRLARRLASDIASTEPDATDAFAAALYFVVWTELCTLVPIRHIARDIYRQTPDRTILVPCSAPEINCLGYWSINQLEPFYLVAELHRLGARAFLYAPSTQRFAKAFEKKRLCLTIGLEERHWRSGTAPLNLAAPAGPIICEDGVRNLGLVQSEVETQQNSRPAQVVQGVRPLIWDTAKQSGRLEVPYELLVKSRLARRYRPAKLFPSLQEGFRFLVGDLTMQAWSNAQTLFTEDDAPEVHVCDHPFFASALLAFAAKARRGTIEIWPHSTNAIVSDNYAKLDVERVSAATVSSKSVWDRVFPSSSRRVISTAALPLPSAPKPYDDNAPIHVVFFAGAHRLARMPITNIDRHMRSLRALFAGLNDLPDGFEVLLKSKTIWETEPWLSELLPPAPRLTFTDAGTGKLDLPNMVFVSASFGSSALLEGISKGVPALVAREFPVHDYTALSAEAGQVGNLAFVLAQLRSFKETGAYDRAVARNLEWFRNETVFPGTAVDCGG